MANTVTLGVTTVSGANTNSYASGAFTPAANDFLVAFVVASGTTTVAATMTDSQSLGFSLIADVAFNAGADHVYCFVANKRAANSSMTVTFDCTGDNATGASIYVARCAGTEIIFKQTGTNSGAASTTPAVTMPMAFGTNSLGLGCVGNGVTPAALTEPGSWTETNGVDTGHTPPATGQECVNRVSGETGTTITWGATSGTAWGAIVAEIFTSGENGYLFPAALSSSPSKGQFAPILSM